MRTLKSLLIASAAVMTLSAPVLAADAIQEQPPVPAPVEMAPQYSWAGGYTGLYLGYGWNKFKTDTAAGDIKANDMKAGAYAGWNFQQDSIVYGLEGGAGYSGAKQSALGGEAEYGFEGSSRGRLGVALDPIMPY
ncbi:porin family protein, partial [Paraburkholderia aspalathi]|nr:porin family protein [Paraburkholderia aspalathi]